LQQEVVLALLAKEPSYGYELRARLRKALGPLGDAMNPGHVYVTLTRLEKAGLVASERPKGSDPGDTPDRPDRKVYQLTADGQQRVAEWLAEVSWPKPDGSDAGLLLEGIVLRLQADLRWLEACEQSWTGRRSGS
jgi:DNA-binding PadR family transcriptional regulator